MSSKSKSKKKTKGGSSRGEQEDSSDREVPSQSESSFSSISLGSEGSQCKNMTPAERERDREIKKQIAKFIGKHNSSGEKKGMTYTQDELILVLDRVKGIFRKQDMLLKVRAPVRVVGDIHGQFNDLKRLMRANGKPPKVKFVFLGDYVDRGQHSLECIVYLFAYKALFPESFIMLRGNHECMNVNRAYGFYDELQRRGFAQLYPEINDIFSYMPLACTINHKILCMHGGISQHIKAVDDIKRLERPMSMLKQKENSPTAMDLLWADPEKKKMGYNKSKRGVSSSFGMDVCDEFCTKNKLEFIVRGHQVVPRGFERLSHNNKTRCVTVFSAPNYCGEMDNCAGVMVVDEKLKVKFAVLDPSTEKVAVAERQKEREHVPEYDVFPEIEIDLDQLNAVCEKAANMPGVAAKGALVSAADFFRRSKEVIEHLKK